MSFIKIKPLSVNDAWQGKRYKTDEYKAYEAELYYKRLPRDLVVPEGELQAWIVWGFSNSGSDVDNPCKPFLDVLQKKYNFNDNKIFRLLQDKHLVPKGEEFISFQISALGSDFVSEENNKTFK